MTKGVHYWHIFIGVKVLKCTPQHLGCLYELIVIESQQVAYLYDLLVHMTCLNIEDEGITSAKMLPSLQLRYLSELVVIKHQHLGYLYMPVVIETHIR